MPSLKTYFVTGATGAIGSALVPLLLATPETQVRLLLRADSAEALHLRLETLFQFWGVDPEDVGWRGRVWAMRGDVTLPRFGLSDQDHAALCADCTHLIHTAGIVRMNLPLDAARQSAVGAAQHLVELARACPRLEKVEFVSTVGVGGRLTVVPETWINTPRVFHNTYEQAKAEAEEVVRDAVNQGLALTVHRPSMVVGDARTGRIIHFQIFYHLCEFLSGRRTFGLLPRLGEARLDIVPVDHVAGTIAWSSGQPELAGRILHLCAGPEGAIRLVDLRRHVRRLFALHGLKTPPGIGLPPRLLQRALKVASRFMDDRTRRALSPLPIFLDYLAEEQRFENTTTFHVLERAGISVQKWESYLDGVLGNYLKHDQ